MNRKEEILKELNQILDVDVFKKDIFFVLIKELKPLGIVKTKFYDFSFHNEDLANSLKQNKINLVKQQEFEGAANIRDKEKETINYLELKKELAVEKSIFVLRDDCLLYCHFGNAKNDEKTVNSIR